MNDRRIGVDLGGTKIRGVVVDTNGEIVAGPIERPTGREQAQEEILGSLIEVVQELRRAAGGKPAGVGIGIPTTLDADGRTVHCPNLPAIAGVKIRPKLEKCLGQRIVLDNDANCFVYGEWRIGAGKGADTCCGITLGTGFGMGLIIAGRLHRGTHGGAGEICSSPFRDGRRIEEVVSGIGIAKHYQSRTGQLLDAGMVAQKACEGDENAVAVWQEFGEALGFALSYTVNVLDPEAVVIGGSAAAAWEWFFPAMHATLQRYAYDPTVLGVVPGSLGPLAGAVGAGMLPEQ